MTHDAEPRTEPQAPAFHQGVVMRSTGSFYRVRTASGELVDCTLRGKIRLEGLKTTNPIAVGDHIRFRWDEGAAVIHDILPRENYILRRSTRSSALQQILCANINQAIMIFSVIEPHTPIGYLDRFLVMAEAYHIPAVVVFNKIDRVQKEKDLNRMVDFIITYEDIGYPVHKICALDPEFTDEIRTLLQGKVSFLSGVSGSGKSSLINLADPELNLKTSPISGVNKKGRHTTTYAEMFPLSFGGWIIDAPGFKEFEITGIERGELSHYFPEMRALLPECRFNNCTHTNEPGCAVIAAVEEGDLAHTRYHTYLSMLENLEPESWS